MPNATIGMTNEEAEAWYRSFSSSSFSSVAATAGSSNSHSSSSPATTTSVPDQHQHHQHHQHHQNHQHHQHNQHPDHPSPDPQLLRLQSTWTHHLDAVKQARLSLQRASQIHNTKWLYFKHVISSWYYYFMSEADRLWLVNYLTWDERKEFRDAEWVLWRLVNEDQPRLVVAMDAQNVEMSRQRDMEEEMTRWEGVGRREEVEERGEEVVVRREREEREEVVRREREEGVVQEMVRRREEARRLEEMGRRQRGERERYLERVEEAVKRRLEVEIGRRRGEVEESSEERPRGMGKGLKGLKEVSRRNGERFRRWMEESSRGEGEEGFRTCVEEAIRRQNQERLTRSVEREVDRRLEVQWER